MAGEDAKTRSSTDDVDESTSVTLHSFYSMWIQACPIALVDEIPAYCVRPYAPRVQVPIGAVSLGVQSSLSVAERDHVWSMEYML